MGTVGDGRDARDAEDHTGEPERVDERERPDRVAQRPEHPLELGADIVVHSATKFCCGHSDTMAGVVCVNDDALAKQIYFVANAEGTALAPFDCWLLLRGLKTMHLRTYKAQENAIAVARFLKTHAKVTRVLYAGLPDHPGHALHASQSSGGEAESRRPVARIRRCGSASAVQNM